jgi:hypothetical protein
MGHVLSAKVAGKCSRDVETELVVLGSGKAGPKYQLCEMVQHHRLPTAKFEAPPLLINQTPFNLI